MICLQGSFTKYKMRFNIFLELFEIVLSLWEIYKSNLVLCVR